MTEETADTDDRAPADDRSEYETEGEADGGAGTTSSDGPGTGRSLVEYVQLALLAILVLVVAVATLRFYFAASTAVDRFVTRQYRPLFQAAFNVVVLLAAGVGLSMLVRRLS